jgi:hypothetical protein
VPFQFTFEPETKPVPFTVRVNPAPPGATLVGTKGSLMNGTGFGLCADNGSPQQAITSKARKAQTQRTDASIVHSWEAASCGVPRRAIYPQFAT